MIRSLILPAVAALPLAAPAAAQPVCSPGAAWTYSGTAKGTPRLRDTGKGTQIDFSPSGANDADSVVFSSTNAADAGTYQVNADIDVVTLSADATIALEGATSAAVGRPFEVGLAAGTGGSSGFSRPITTTGQPFTILIRTRAPRPLSFKVRNFTVCKLR